MNGFHWEYDFSTVQLPSDGSRPQPVLPVVDGFQCRKCPVESRSRPFTSTNEKRMRVHGNEQHKQKRVDGDELFRKVRLQSWFQDRRQRYWVVDECGSESDSRDEDIGIQEQEVHANMSSIEDESVVEDNPDKQVVEQPIVVGIRDEEEEIIEAVSIEEEVDKVVVESEEEVVDVVEEVLSAFDDSEDEDYRESSGDVRDGDTEGGSSEIEVEDSGDEDYEDEGGVPDDNEEGSSMVEDLSDEEDEAVAIESVGYQNSKYSKKRRATKRKTIDTDGMYQDISPTFRRWDWHKTTKQFKRMRRFNDSGVVMGSSQGDSAVQSSSQDDSMNPPSSPTVRRLDWHKAIEQFKRKRRFHDNGGAMGRSQDNSVNPPSSPPIARVIHKDTSSDGADVAIQPRIESHYFGTAQSKSPQSRGKRRKMGRKFKDRGWRNFDWSSHHDSSPGNRGMKQQRMMTGFGDSAVVIGISQDDSAIPPSSPAGFGSMISTSPRDIDDTERSSTVMVHDDKDNDRKNAPIDSQAREPRQETAQSRLNHLWDRLEKWCQTCPVCHLAGNFGDGHHMTNCWRDRTVDIIDEVVEMQQHIETFGGFKGREGCQLCGIPRAICQRWQVKTGVVVEEQRCQYVWMLVPAVITMLMNGSSEGRAVVGVWMDQDGVNRAKQDEVFEWFRQQRWWNDVGMEVAQIVRVFHMLVNKNIGVGIV